MTARLAKDVNDLYIFEYFRLKEFECRCCHHVLVHPDMLFKVNRIRQMLEVPVLVTSAFRCPAHNKEVGGHPESGHMRGECCDFQVPRLHPRRVISAIYAAGFKKVVLYGPDLLVLEYELGFTAYPRTKVVKHPTIFYHAGL